MIRYGKYNYVTMELEVWNPQDADESVCVEIFFKWHILKGESPSFDYPYGIPDEYDFELIKFSKPAEWITEEIILDEMCQMDWTSLDRYEYV